MGTPHKHAELIKAWADGAEIQSRMVHGKWCTCTPAWSTDPNVEYRIKPKTIRYRLYLNKFGEVRAVNNGEEDIISWFVKWLGDWQEVEV